MSQDVVADGLNMVKNAGLAGNESVKIKRISNLLIDILKIMRQKNAVKKYKFDSRAKSVEVFVGELSECRAIKPRFSADKNQIEKYRRRYLPSRNLGTLIISTNQGLMGHDEAKEKGIGGSLIAYFY